MVHRYLEKVVTLTLDTERCIGCGRCAEVCPHRVFRVENRKAVIRSRDLCMECGACAINCPAEAISVHASVGCAAAILAGWLTGSAPSCDCSGGGDCC